MPTGWTEAASRLQPELISWWTAAVVETKALLAKAARGMQSGILGNDLEVLEALGCFDKRVNGAGTITAVAAIYLASRNAPRPQSGLMRAAFMSRADTDTVASMTAALLGALHGSDWLEPLSSQVQDRNYVARLADGCTSLAIGEANASSSPVQPVRDSDLRAFRAHLQATDAAPQSLPGGRMVHSAHSSPLQSRTTAEAVRWLLDVEGQTMVVDVVERRARNEPPSQQPTGDTRQPAASATVRRISIRAQDPDAIEAFYGPRGLGLSIKRLSADEVLVDGTIRFVKPNTDAAQDFGGVYLEIQVSDVEVALNRVGASRNSNATITRLRDPAGNDVGLFERSP
jgi:hypothetical protein